MRYNIIGVINQPHKNTQEVDDTKLNFPPKIVIVKKLTIIGMLRKFIVLINATYYLGLETCITGANYLLTFIFWG